MKAMAIVFATASLAIGASPKSLAAAERAPFGALTNGEPVEAVTLVNKNKMSVTLLTYGATIQALQVPDKKGVLADVVLGFPTIEGYLNHPVYFGSSVGRFANRIGNAKFPLDGQEYPISQNDGKNSLHGGAGGFDKVNWKIESVVDGREPSATMSLASPDGDQGYPGALAVTAKFVLRDDNSLTIDYDAQTDKTTIVSMTCHPYFNLGGEGSGDAMRQNLTIPADAFTPVDEGLIPTGEIKSVEGTPFDFRKPTPVGERIRQVADPQIAIGRGYDHNWVLSRTPTKEARLVARLEDPEFGRAVEILSNQPGIQFYSGNYLDGTFSGKSGRAYRQGDAVVLEPQLFPDTPNKPEFGSARLEPGQTYHHQIIYRFLALRGK